jgi:hypothetical protein
MIMQVERLKALRDALQDADGPQTSRPSVHGTSLAASTRESSDLSAADSSGAGGPGNAGTPPPLSSTTSKVTAEDANTSPRDVADRNKDDATAPALQLRPSGSARSGPDGTGAGPVHALQALQPMDVRAIRAFSQ